MDAIPVRLILDGFAPERLRINQFVDLFLRHRTGIVISEIAFLTALEDFTNGSF